jgi:hypothetical protein
MKALNSGRVAGLIMPAAFIISIIFCLVRVGQTATHQYFVNKPVLRWEHTTSGEPHAALVWAAVDADANWQVRYHAPSEPQWRTAFVRLARRVNSDLLTQHLVYNAELSDLSPGAGGEYEVYRNQLKVYAARIP